LPTAQDVALEAGVHVAVLKYAAYLMPLALE